MTPMELLTDYSLDVTAKETDQIREAATIIPKNTQILIPFLPGEDFETRVTAVKIIKEYGFVPMPTLAARRFRTRQELDGYLDRLKGIDRVFVVAGDPPHPEGPFEDALSVINALRGVQHVGISGYPNGHPRITREGLRRSLREKHAALMEMDLECSIVTQLDFDAERVLGWAKEVRAGGISAPVRVGIPGPMEFDRLVSFAKRCGVSPSEEYSKTNEMVEGLAKGYDPEVHGKIQLHFYPFGEVKKTVAWIRDYKKSLTTI